jgi:tripartite-type tricarboxylate transporter receptor subunit TctC
LSPITDKRIKALALTTARRAAPPLDFIPPIADTLPGFDAAGWSGLAAPARTPLEIVAKVNRDVNALLQDPAVVREIERRAGMPAPGSPIQFAEFIKKEIDTWGEVVRATGTKPGT